MENEEKKEKMGENDEGVIAKATISRLQDTSDKQSCM